MTLIVTLCILSCDALYVLDRDGFGSGVLEKFRWEHYAVFKVVDTPEAMFFEIIITCLLSNFSSSCLNFSVIDW